MAERSKTYYALLNTGMKTVLFILGVLMRFGTRTVFIYFLGKEYLGLNGLFVSVISMLSVAELGLAPTIAYSLYKPLVNKEFPQVKALMRLYQRAYRLIGVAIGVLGICVLPFLDKLIKNGEGLKYVHLLFALYLFNSVLTYFTSYKRSLLAADQKDYLNVINLFIASIFILGAQIAILYLTQNYMLYIICDIFFTLIANLWINRRIDKMYPFLRRAKRVRLDKDTLTTLKKNLLGNLSMKLSGLVLYASDNIIISTFIGIVTVGVFSNYWLIYVNLQGVIANITNSIGASIGHATVSDDGGKKAFDLYKKHYFITFCVTAVFATSFIYCVNPLISVWLDKTYLFGDEFAMLLGAQFALMAIRNTASVFIPALGLAWAKRYMAILEAVLNVGFSLFFLFVCHLGVYSVVFGTMCAVAATGTWFEPYILFKRVFFKPMRQFVRISAVYFLVLLLCVLASGGIIMFMPFLGLARLLASGLICVFVCIVLIWLVYRNTSEFDYMIGTIGRIFGKGFSKLKGRGDRR